MFRDCQTLRWPDTKSENIKGAQIEFPFKLWTSWEVRSVELWVWAGFDVTENFGFLAGWVSNHGGELGPPGQFPAPTRKSESMKGAWIEFSFEV